MQVLTSCVSLFVPLRIVCLQGATAAVAPDYFAKLTMRIKAFPLLWWLVWLLSALLSLPSMAASDTAAAAAPAAPPTLDNASCLSCHDGKKGKLEVPAPEGKKRELRSVASAKFGQSVHANMQCVACHTDIVDNADKDNAHTLSLIHI